MAHSIVFLSQGTDQVKMSILRVGRLMQAGT